MCNPHVTSSAGPPAALTSTPGANPACLTPCAKTYSPSQPRTRRLRATTAVPRPSFPPGPAPRTPWPMLPAPWCRRLHSLPGSGPPTPGPTTTATWAAHGGPGGRRQPPRVRQTGLLWAACVLSALRSQSPAQRHVAIAVTSPRAPGPVHRQTLHGPVGHVRDSKPVTRLGCCRRSAQGRSGARYSPQSSASNVRSRCSLCRCAACARIRVLHAAQCLPCRRPGHQVLTRALMVAGASTSSGSRREGAGP